MEPIEPAPDNAVESGETRERAGAGQAPPQVGEPTRAEQPPSSPESRLPPEAQGEVNGGPLGCCLGVTIGLVLSLSVAILSRLFADPLAQALHGWLALTVRIVMGLLALACAIICGYFGWKIGRTYYREYELSPRQQQRLARLEQRQLERLRRKR